MCSYYLSSNLNFKHTHILNKTSIYLHRQDIAFYYACTKIVHAFFAYIIKIYIVIPHAL